MKFSKNEIITKIVESGFSCAAFFDNTVVCALPYGNVEDSAANNAAANNAVADADTDAAVTSRAIIAPFARRNYYREAVRRLQKIVALLRSGDSSYKKSDCRILCNSRENEKQLASMSGLGVYGRNGLILTREAGSLVVLAALTLPVWGRYGGEAPVERVAKNRRFVARGRLPPHDFPFCSGCPKDNPPCVASCPTAALAGDGRVELSRCIQWYASGNGEVPDFVRAQWGRRFYGCTNCQDACPHNQKKIAGVQSSLGELGAYVDAHEILSLSDAGIKTKFKGTALGLSWLGPAALRRNARLALDSLPPVVGRFLS
jgi:epoxyqueuosine reductase